MTQAHPYPPEPMPDRLLDQRDEALIDAYGTALEAVTGLNRAFDKSLRSQAGMPSTWFEALLRLHRHGESMTVGQLGDQLAFTSGGATRLVDRLEEEGLVARHPCPTDRRVQFVDITERGTRALADGLDVHLPDLRRLVGERLSAEDREELRRICEILRGDAPGPAPDLA